MGGFLHRIKPGICFKLGSAFFQRFSDSLRFILTSEGHYCINYIDDYVLFGNEAACSAAFIRLQELLTELGLDISTHKNVSPSTKVTCLGVLVDTENFTVSVPPEKLEEIKNLCRSWDKKSKCTKNQLQSLLGSLLYVSKCVRQSRFFLNRLLHTLRCATNKNSIRLDDNFKKDISWFNTFLEDFNGVSFFDKPPIQGEIYLDASIKALGACFQNEIYHHTFDEKFTASDITSLEMINILVAIKIWSKKWKSKHILVHCDNLAVVTIISSGKTRDNHLATISRNIWLECAKFDIQLTVKHISGKKNMLADLLSRWQNSVDNKKQLSQLLPNHSWVKLPTNILELNLSI